MKDHNEFLRFVQYDQTRIAVYFSKNKDDNRFLVLFPSYCTSFTNWRPYFDYFRTRHSIVTFDPIGFGLSDKPKDSRFYTPMWFYNSLKTVFDQFNLSKQVILIGHSLGGMNALNFAIKHPDLVKSVVLMNTGLFIDNKWIKMTKLLPPLFLWNLMKHLAVKPANNLLYSPSTDKEIKKNFIDQAMKIENYILSNLIRKALELNLRDKSKLNKLKIPVLSVYSKEDAIVPSIHGKILVEYLPQTEVVVLPRGGHMLPFEFPNQVITQIDHFVQKSTSRKID